MSYYFANVILKICSIKISDSPLGMTALNSGALYTEPPAPTSLYLTSVPDLTFEQAHTLARSRYYAFADFILFSPSQSVSTDL